MAEEQARTSAARKRFKKREAQLGTYAQRLDQTARQLMPTVVAHLYSRKVTRAQVAEVVIGMSVELIAAVDAELDKDTDNAENNAG